jgi:hypothetical protein
MKLPQFLHAGIIATFSKFPEARLEAILFLVIGVADESRFHRMEHDVMADMCYMLFISDGQIHRVATGIDVGV